MNGGGWPVDRLDDLALIEQADPGGMLRQVASSAAQVRTAVRICREQDLGSAVGTDRPRAVVVAGMGGSGIAGDVLAALCGPGCPIQITTVHDHRLPGWVGAADLVIAVSCSGSTEETLAAATEAARRGCRLIGVGAADSPLEHVATQSRAPFVPVRSAGMPRSTLWGLTIPLVVIAEHLGLVRIGEDGYERAAVTLEQVSQQCRPGSESFVNPAKALAVELLGTLPVIWGTSPLSAVAARRFACQLNENAKYPAVAGVLPEAGHNQVVAFDGPFAHGGDLADTAASAYRRLTPLRLVTLADPDAHPRVAARHAVSVDLARQRDIGVSELPMTGEHPLDRLAGVVQLIDYTTVYLGIAVGVDPTPIAVIADLKERIT